MTQGKICDHRNQTENQFKLEQKSRLTKVITGKSSRLIQSPDQRNRGLLPERRREGRRGSNSLMMSRRPLVSKGSYELEEESSTPVP